MRISSITKSATTHSCDTNHSRCDNAARMMDPIFGRFTTPDPLAEKYYNISPYAHCANNPVNKIDLDGKLEWPVNNTYQGKGRTHEDNWHAPRKGGRLHQGVDINHLGGGDTDKGAPINATHSGTVTRVGNIRDGNNGGNRIRITSADGTVSTFYMHLDTKSPGIKVGSEIKEGQQIGTMGGSGANTQNKYPAHLHYEISLDGVNINPANGKDHLVDPQLIIDSRSNPQQEEVNYNGGTLPEVIVVAPTANPRPLPQIPVTNITRSEIKPI